MAVRDQDNRIVDGTLDRLEASTVLKVYTNPRTAGTADDGNQSPLLQAPLTMIFDSQGWISLEAIGIKGGLLEEQLNLGSSGRDDAAAFQFIAGVWRGRRVDAP
ncbi:MAG: hypothetical protein R2873_09380 [Caldilineaceae bacterium]